MNKHKSMELEHKKATVGTREVSQGRMVAAGHQKSECMRCEKKRHCDEMGLCRKCYKWVRERTKALMGSA